ncbi:polysaccharide biosynthesis tyrosine autokinase [Geodermatophilus amargosae]|uniref:polysaccharide biosynthesis tyrosine autokinase n=1 Tax=Geodermatophilus amargosae TaxID=1296565 RepID=UPI0034DEF27D
MDSRGVWAALRRAWWLPVLGALVGGAVALAVSLLQTPVYTASTQLFVSTTNAGTTSDAFQGSQFSEERVASYARLLTGEELARRVIDELGLDTSPASLREEVVATPVPDTVLIDVSVTDPDPQQAQDIAAAVGSEFRDLVSELETPPGTSSSPVRVLVVEPPDLPTSPTSPQTARSTVIGVLAGLLLGAAAALVRVRLDRSVRDRDQVTALTGAPVLGVVPRDLELEKSHLIDRQNTTGGAEAFRQLRTNLQFISPDEPPRVIMVTSAVPGEGKTTLAVNLAVVLAEAGTQVILVEADLRRPRVTRYLGLVGGVGLTNILAGTATIDEVVQRYGDHLAVIGAGPTPPNPGELLSSSLMSSFLDDLRAKNDIVLVDAPPVLPVADASGLGALVDGTVLSVRYGVTTRDQVHQAAMTLRGVGARTLGVVLNLVPPRSTVASAYGYEYSASYGPESPEP